MGHDSDNFIKVRIADLGGPVRTIEIWQNKRPQSHPKNKSDRPSLSFKRVCKQGAATVLGVEISGTGRGGAPLVNGDALEPRFVSKEFPVDFVKDVITT